MKKVCYLFPGQGAQYVGMGKDFYENSPQAKKIFDQAEEILPDLGIKKLCFEGPMEELTQTANSQVAILVVSIAALKTLCSRLEALGERQNVVSCAGLSLGELTALVASGSIEFSDAVRLVRRRGELMEEASLKNPGSMASIIGISLDKVEEICKKTGAEVANLNCPGQIVITGKKDAVTSAKKLSEELGARKAMILNVSGPFHSSLMKEAATLFGKELDRVGFETPAIKVVSNVTSDYEKNPEEIKENLVKQLFSPVRWEASIRRVAKEGVSTFFEIGPGRVLKGLLRRIDANLKVYNIEKMEDLKQLSMQN